MLGASWDGEAGQRGGGEEQQLARDAIIVAGARALGRGTRLQPSRSGASFGSETQLQQDWVNAGEVSSGGPEGNLDPVMSSTVMQFIEYREQLKEFTKGSLGKLLRLEQTIVLPPSTRPKLRNSGAGWQRDQLQGQVDRLIVEKDRQAAAHQAELNLLAEEHNKALGERDEMVGKAAKEVVNLKAEYDRRASDWSMKEQGMLAEVQHINELLANAFPGTQDVAEDAVNLQREEERARGVHIGMLASWMMAETGIATKA